LVEQEGRMATRNKWQKRELWPLSRIPNVLWPHYLGLCSRHSSVLSFHLGT
jgi:hypothetical protein